MRSRINRRKETRDEAQPSSYNLHPKSFCVQTSSSKKTDNNLQTKNSSFDRTRETDDKSNSLSFSISAPQGSYDYLQKLTAIQRQSETPKRGLNLGQNSISRPQRNHSPISPTPLSQRKTDNNNSHHHSSPSPQTEDNHIQRVLTTNRSTMVSNAGQYAAALWGKNTYEQILDLLDSYHTTYKNEGNVVPVLEALHKKCNKWLLSHKPDAKKWWRRNATRRAEIINLKNQIEGQDHFAGWITYNQIGERIQAFIKDYDERDLDNDGKTQLASTASVLQNSIYSWIDRYADVLPEQKTVLKKCLFSIDEVKAKQYVPILSEHLEVSDVVDTLVSKYNPKDHIFVGAGASPATVIAMLNARGCDTRVFPLSSFRDIPKDMYKAFPHIGGVNSLSEKNETQVTKMLQHHFPSREELGERDIVVIDYTKGTGASLIAAAANIKKYYQGHVKAVALTEFYFSSEKSYKQEGDRLLKALKPIHPDSFVYITNRSGKYESGAGKNGPGADAVSKLSNILSVQYYKNERRPFNKFAPTSGHKWDEQDYGKDQLKTGYKNLSNMTEEVEKSRGLNDLKSSPRLNVPSVKYPKSSMTALHDDDTLLDRGRSSSLEVEVGDVGNINELD